MALNITVHKNILLKILKDIYSDTTISPVLGFKGGTAAYLFYDLGRFSVDLDFDLLDPSKEDDVFIRIKDILSAHGVVKDAKRKRFNLFYVLSYDQKIEGAQNIKIEINRRDFGSEYELKSYLGISMKVMVRGDMAAHKLVAMYERIGKTNRDLFDVWFFLKNNWPVNEKIVQKRTGLAFKEFLNKCVEAIEKMPKRSVLAGIGELLDEKQKPWVKENLREDAIFLLSLLRENSKF